MLVFFENPRKCFSSHDPGVVFTFGSGSDLDRGEGVRHEHWTPYKQSLDHTPKKIERVVIQKK